LGITSAAATFAGYLWLYWFPLYLKFGLGFADTDVGVVYTFGGICFGLSLLPGGILGDSYGRKTLVVLGSFLIAIPSILLAAAPLAALAVASYIILQFGLSFFQSNYQSMITESVKKERRGVALGTFSSFSSAFASVSPFIAAVVLSSNYGYNQFLPLFVAASVILVSTTIVRSTFLKESLARDFKKIIPLGIRMKETMTVYREKNLFRLLIAYCIHDFGLTMVIPFLPIFLVQKLKAASFYLALVLFIPAMGLLLFQIPFGKLSDRFGRKIVVLVSFIGELIFILLFSLSSYTLANGLVFGVIFWSLAVASGQMDIAAKTAWLADASAPEKRSTLIGSFSSLSTLVGSLGPLVGGILFSKSEFLPFFVTGFLLILAFLVLVSISDRFLASKS
jgi:MFS family permease